jgi:uncharacterized protein YprB with RNaseH-like and TPR domain
MPNKLEYERRLKEGRCTRCGTTLVSARTGFAKCQKCQDEEGSRRRGIRAVFAKPAVKPIESLQNSRSIKLFLDPAQTRVAVLDIESTGLFGDFDLPLCVVIKTYGKNERHVLSIDMNRRSLLDAEKKLLKEVQEVLDGYEGLITYYGTGFDVPFLRTRMLANGMEPLKKMMHLDGYYTVRGKLRLSRNRLQAVIELLRFVDKDIPEKGRVDPEYWVRAAFGRDEMALGYIIDHCIEDVDCLEAVVNKLRDYFPDKVMRR